MDKGRDVLVKFFRGRLVNIFRGVPVKKKLLMQKQTSHVSKIVVKKQCKSRSMVNAICRTALARPGPSKMGNIVKICCSFIHTEVKVQLL